MSVLFPIDTLIARDRQRPVRIAVVGDAMEDVWVRGTLATCADGCTALKVTERYSLPGGAANAAGQLVHWNAEPFLVAAIDEPGRISGKERWGFADDFCFPGRRVTRKTRYVTDAGQTILRIDQDADAEPLLGALGEWIGQELNGGDWQGVLLSDYAKGLLHSESVRLIIEACRRQEIPVVADAKQHPWAYRDAVLQFNEAYADRFSLQLHAPHHYPGLVRTRGPLAPGVWTPAAAGWRWLDERPEVRCVNHVGAGDCFAAHLTLALAHGLELPAAAKIAHAAGRVFVQHAPARPPWPHEIRRDLDPVRGKILSEADAGRLRSSLKGKRVVANGVFRLPHAGHAWLLDWARRQGDVLIVLVNDDSSASEHMAAHPHRRGGYVLPLPERARLLASMAAVDWVVPFSAPTPEAVLAELGADVLVKGHEYAGTTVPGAGLVGEVRFAPESPEPRHASHLVADITRAEVLR